jgi:hypothetical protein
MHEEVIQAMHGIDMAQKSPQVTERTMRDLPSDRLIPPHTSLTLYPPQT